MESHTGERATRPQRRSRIASLLMAGAVAAALMWLPASAAGQQPPGPIFEDLGTGIADVHVKTSFAKGPYTINVQKVTIPVGGIVPWHCHPGPVTFVITQGELTHWAPDGTSDTLVAGQADVEIIGALRMSQSTGTEPFEGVIIFASPEGEPGTYWLAGPDEKCPK